MKRVYELERMEGASVSLRLTAVQLQNYLKTNFKDAMVPLVGVMQAIERIDLLVSLLTFALRGADNAGISGGALYDELVDEGWDSARFAALVVEIADVSGLIPQGQKEDLLEAAVAGKAGVTGAAKTLTSMLNGAQPSQGGEGEGEGTDPTPTN